MNLARNYLTDCREDGSTLRLPQAIVVGARRSYEIIDTADLSELVGLVLEPGSFACLFRDRADLLFEKSISLAELWPRFEIEQIPDAATPANKLAFLEKLVLEQTRESKTRLPAIEGAIRFLDSQNANVRDCARFLGISERRLSQLFREQVGVSPKLWCRIQRFQAALNGLRRGAEIPWAELALCCGYYDQSHFINDFHAFSGLNPVTYSSLCGPWKNHIPLA